ncbi:MAG TPA: Uma2 family endonuclease [Candidatus Elarobacter sp.]|jgi:Uma2 family endonuclease
MEIVRRPITVEEYTKMAERGILDPDERVELLDGDIVVVPPQGEGHFSVVARLNWHLTTRFGKRVLVTVQQPVIVSERSEPEPDIALLFLRDDFYRSGIPRTSDVFAMVEVADSSIRVDRGIKLRIYAEAGVPDYWIVDVKRERIEVYRDPADGVYGSLTTLRRGETVAFLAFPDELFAVEELIG